MAKKTVEIEQSVIPTLVVDGAAKAIELYKKALGAKEEYRMNDPNSGKIVHACIQIGNSKLFLCDVNPNMGVPSPIPSKLYVYLPDVDASFKQAKQAGLSEVMPPQDMFWGDRMGAVKDPFGISWTLATHVREVSPKELEEGQKKFFGGKAA